MLQENSLVKSSRNLFQGFHSTFPSNLDFTSAIEIESMSSSSTLSIRQFINRSSIQLQQTHWVVVMPEVWFKILSHPTGSLIAWKTIKHSVNDFLFNFPFSFDWKHFRARQMWNYVKYDDGMLSWTSRRPNSDVHLAFFFPSSSLLCWE